MDKKAKNIAVFGNFLSVWGFNKATCEELSERLASNNWTVTTASNQKNRLFRIIDMVVTAFKNKDMYSAAVVEVYSGPSLLWAEAVCEMLKFLNKPYILALHGGRLPAFGNEWPRRIRRLLRSAKYVTAPSRYLQDKMKIFRNDIIVIPNPIELSSYHFRHRDNAKAKLLWVRAFHRIYNPTLVPQVLHLLQQEGILVEMIMVGPDKKDGSFDETKELLKKFDVDESVTFYGAVPKKKIPDILATNDIFLNTTNIDNTPLSIIEAMGTGLCIISTKVGGIPYLLENEFDALLVPANNPQFMAEAVKRILTEPKLSQKISLNARRKAEGLSWDHVLTLWEDLLKITTKK